MNPETLTWEQAQELLAARRDSVPMPRKATTRGRATKAKTKATAARGTKRKAAGA
jgi:topoisomerase IA-like protein